MLSKNELVQVKGGATITYSLINSLTKAVSTIFDLGRAIGSSLRRIVKNDFC